MASRRVFVPLIVFLFISTQVIYIVYGIVFNIKTGVSNFHHVSFTGQGKNGITDKLNFRRCGFHLAVRGSNPGPPESTLNALSTELLKAEILQRLLVQR